MHHPPTDLRPARHRHRDLVREAEQHHLARQARRLPSGRPRRHPAAQAAMVALAALPYVLLVAAALPVWWS